MLGLVLTIAGCSALELAMVELNWFNVAVGYAPALQRLHDVDALYLAIGIVGATVMPHNLYLHSSVVQTRSTDTGMAAKREAMRFGTMDAIVSLSLALLVNAWIMILAASAFHGTGHTNGAEIEDAYHLVNPIVGGSRAAFLFGIALLASGQSSTFTGTIAGQIVMEGFIDFKISCWKRRLITRMLALVPAFIGLAWYGASGVGKILVLNQVVLSFQLPFVIWPLVQFTSDRELMGDFANGSAMKTVAWPVCAVISAAMSGLCSHHCRELRPSSLNEIGE